MDKLKNLLTERNIEVEYKQTILHGQGEKVEDLGVYFELVGLVLHSVEERELN